MEIEEILGKIDHGVAPGVAELLKLTAEDPTEVDEWPSPDFVIAAGIVAALDRLTEAVKEATGESARPDVRVLARIVRDYDDWLAQAPEPERIRDADMKLAGVIRELRSLGGGDHPR